MENQMGFREYSIIFTFDSDENTPKDWQIAINPQLCKFRHDFNIIYPTLSNQL